MAHKHVQIIKYKSISSSKFRVLNTYTELLQQTLSDLKKIKVAAVLRAPPTGYG